jgi:hypothetical protein
MAPHFGPKHIPESRTKNTCRVRGTRGKGILIHAPAAVRQTNNPARIIDLISELDIVAFTSRKLSVDNPFPSNYPTLPRITD